MKKIFALLPIILLTLSLSSCFLFGVTTTHPDMVEYRSDEVLSVAKEKYGIVEWIFTDTEIHGDARYDSEGDFCLEFYTEQFGTEFVNSDNIEVAMQAFAGKNGNHDIQGRYYNFLCCIALGKCADGSLKFVYYNTNIHKDAKIADTVGASDYIFEVSPVEITNDLFTVDSRWAEMQSFLNECKDSHPRGLHYSGERLAIRHDRTTYSFVEFEFYKEDGKIVYDVFYTNDYEKPEDRRIVYSTSENYGVIYNYYGLDKSQYFDVTKTVTPSADESGVMVLWGNVKAKPIEGTVLYSAIGYEVSYLELNDKGKIVEAERWDQVYDKLSFERGYGFPELDGVDHVETSDLTIYDFYIFYRKSLVSE